MKWPPGEVSAIAIQEPADYALFYEGDSPDETTNTNVLHQVVLPPFFHAYDIRMNDTAD